jgi:alginate O-acetyltransferase complex protein AlgI
MLFCSREYLVFFLGVFAVYWLLPWARLRVWLLLGASFYFYASWNHWLAGIVVVSTLADYVVARGLDATGSARLRRLLLGLSLFMNLGVLVYFKYANFFLHSLEQALTAAGSTASLPVLKVILPIGISFYTFEAINYIVDVYRRRIPAERNLANFLLFILFFPHLVAGPIVRARDFLPQTRRRKRWNWSRAQVGVQFLLVGLLKKLAVADRMALFADPVFANPEQYNTAACWLAVVAYALQIYGDFSGYSDMAVGSAHLLGYHLTKNFDLPYLAANVSDFWRRWHMSLSSWLRDYLFIPLGGSRGTEWQTRRNLLVTMTLGGLWHGASWTFVAWGALHGALLIAHRAFRDFCKTRPRLDSALQRPAGTALRVFATVFAVVLLWVFFRATTFGKALTVFRRLFLPAGGLSAPLNEWGLWVTVAALGMAWAVASRPNGRRLGEQLPPALVGAAYALALSLALLLRPDGGAAFIYFQF